MRKDEILTWAKEHGTDLLIASGVAVAMTGIALLVGHWGNIKLAKVSISGHSLPSDLCLIRTTNEALASTASQTILKIINVKEHLRTLPQGHHPSMARITAAAESSIHLADNQTLVSAHQRNYVV